MTVHLAGDAPASPPSYLGEGGAALWREITATYGLRPDARRLLLDACAEVDLIDRLQEALRDAPLTVRGSQGQEVASPLVSELRQHRQTLRSLLTTLALPDEGGGPSAADKSAVARAAARARWTPRAS